MRARWRSWCRYRRIYRRLRDQVKWQDQTIVASDRATVRARARALAAAPGCPCGDDANAHGHYSGETYCALCSCPRWLGEGYDRIAGV
jgi:hypothetical protein